MDGKTEEVKKFDAIVCLSAIDWDFLWQRTQELMSQFAFKGYPVLFIENTGVRSPGLRDLPRVLHRLRNIFLNIKQQDGVLAQNAKKLTAGEIYSPFILPLPYFKPAISINSSLLIKKIKQFCHEQDVDINRTLLWTYMTTPLALQIIQDLPWGGVVVDIVSDPTKVKGAEKIFASHSQVLAASDFIFCASKPVLETIQKQVREDISRKTLLIEDGFSQPRTEKEGVKKKLRDNVPDDKPIAVYIGGINDKIWWEAVAALVNDNKHVNFVFIGPKEIQQIPVSGDNFYWLPPFTEYKELMSFLSRCSVGLIPYRNNEYVAEMRPAKINEYLVAGLPIMGTNMPELKRFAEETGLGIIYVADNVEEYPSVLECAIKENSETYRSKRRRIVENRSWHKVCREMETLINLHIR